MKNNTEDSKKGQEKEKKPFWDFGWLKVSVVDWGQPEFIGFFKLLGTIFAMGVLAVVLLLVSIPKAEFVSYTEFYERAKAGEVTKISLDIKGGSQLYARTADGDRLKTDNPKYETFKQEMLLLGIDVNEISDVNLVDVVIGFFGSPIFLLGTVSLIMLVYMKNKKNIGVEVESSDKTFADIAGLDSVKAELQSVVDYLKHPEKFKTSGAKLPSGVLLYGEPGVGKTLLAKAVAGEAGISFLSANGSTFIEMYAGIGAARVRSLFEQARASAPCILFIDEIDSVGQSRGTLGENTENRQTLNALLAELDGFESSSDVFVLGATNRIEDLDDALIRPGRFDKHICIPGPKTRAERQLVLELHAKGKTFAPDFDWERASKLTVGLSPAEIGGLLNQSALAAARDGLEAITNECFNNSHFEFVTKGHKVSNSPKSGEELTKEMAHELRVIAYHEAGHAVVGLALGIEVSEVTITGSTSGMGGANFISHRESALKTREELCSLVQMLYGGRVAESLVFGPDQVTTGAVSDIRESTRIIQELIQLYGMNKRGVLLDYSQIETDEALLPQLEALSQELEASARALLIQHRDALEVIASELLAEETLSDTDLKKIWDKHLTVASV
ncbi:MAG: AAA family ATPase [Culicoidibacterales bacterium]